jgi:phosphoserine phosphatase RsbU/P
MAGSPSNAAQLRRQLRRLQLLIQATEHLNSTLELDRLLKVVLQLCTANLQASRGTMYLIDEERHELWSKVVKGKEFVEIRLPLGTGIAGHVAVSGETVNLKDAWKDKRFFAGFDLRSGFQTKTMLCMPMRNRKGKIIGVLQVINKKRGTFDWEDEQFLEAFSDHAALAVENAYLHKALVEKEAVERELRIAAEIQQGLLPRPLPHVPSYDIDAITVPCQTIGGDTYEVVPLSNGKVLLAVADVSGKGIPAALIVSTLHASLHAYLRMGLDLVPLIRQLNSTVYRNTSPERYITFFAGVLDPVAHVLTYVNAGHNHPYHVSATNRSLTALQAGGVPLGMFESADYESGSVRFAPGDTLTMYSDGVTEAMTSSNDEYGESRLQKSVVASLSLDARELRKHIAQDVQAFVAGHPFSDDLTLLVVKRAAELPGSL